jgi:outer membrane cobalamin receptor
VRFHFRTSAVFTLLSLIVSARADAAVVEGRVVDPASRAVPGAQVVVICGAAIAASAITDAEGRFKTSDVAGHCELRVALDGFAAASVALDLPAGGAARDAGTLRLELSAVSESVVVSAAQVDVPLSQASSAVTVITGSELRARQLTTVADALRGVPGLSVARSGGTGSLTSVFPRGGESDYTLVFVDGVQANTFGGGFDFAHLSTDNIERIEIVRGPQSALYGSNAIGAVVRIVTRSGGPLRGDLSVEGGSFGTRHLTAASSGASGAWAWGAGAERLTTDGFNGTRLASGEEVVNDDYERTGAGANGSWRSAAGASMRGELRFERDERGFPGPFGSDPIGAFDGVDSISRGRDDRWIGSLGGTLPSGARVRTHAQVTWNAIDGAFQSPFGSSDSSSTRWTARAQSDIRIARALDLSAGAEFQRERATSTFITDDTGSDIPVTRSIAGYFGEGRWNAADRLFVTGGVRVEDIRRDSLAGISDPFSPRPAFGSDRIVSTNPRAAAAWYIRPGAGRSTKIRAAAGTGIRPPDAFEIAFTDNPSLKPERSRSVEAGVDQAVASGHALLEATAFRNTFDDLIVAVGRFQQSSRYRTGNISNARARGLELASTFRGRAGGLIDVQVRAGYTFLDTDILAVDRGGAAPPPFKPGDPLLRRPRHQWSLDLSASGARASGWIRGGGRGRALDVEPSLGTFGGLFDAPGYAVWNAGAAWRLSKAIELVGRVENLFDRRYEETLGFPALGRGAMAGLRVAASR